MHKIKFILAVFFLLCCFSSYGQKPHVIFIAPDPVDTKNVFWHEFIYMMNKSAEDLSINLEVIHSDSSRLMPLEIVKSISERDVLPTAIVMLAHLRVFPKILQITESKKIYTFVVNYQPDMQDLLQIGYPREKFKYWLGNITPNDQQGGYLLADRLFSMAKNSPPYFTIGFTGAYDSFFVKDRIKGLNKAVNNHVPDIELQQIFNAEWDYRKTQSMLPKVMHRYPDTTIFWSAGGGMSLGLLPLIEQFPEREYIIGEMEWSDSVFKHMMKGHIQAAVGGHFMEGAWALILIHDYLNGLDFIDDIGVDYKSNFTLLTEDSLKQHQKYYLNKQWREINFQHFSKFYNHEIQRYHFILPLP